MSTADFDLPKINGITEEGKRWLTLALDPNHDVPVMPAGLPDSLYPNTIVRRFQYAVDISCPAAITTGTWDAHIRMGPVLALRNASTYTAGNDNAIGIQTLTASTGMWTEAGVVINRLPTGSNSFTAGVANSSFSNLAPAASVFEVGPVRVLGAAIETINTTAPINQQGSVVTYRYDPLVEYGAQMIKLSTDTTQVFSTVATAEFFGPPVDKASAVLYQNSREFHAKEGAYSVVGLNNVHGGFKSATNRCVNISSGATNTELFWAQTATSTAPQQSVCAPYVTMADIDSVGHYYTGLSLSSTLTVKLTLIVESIPDSLDYRPLATPSAIYDPIALEMYLRAIADLPSGVPSSHNFSGKFWRVVRSMLSTAAKYGPFVARALRATPLGPTAEGVAAASVALDKIIPKKKDKQSQGKPRNQRRKSAQSTSS